MDSRTRSLVGRVRFDFGVLSFLPLWVPPTMRMSLIPDKFSGYYGFDFKRRGAFRSEFCFWPPNFAPPDLGPPELAPVDLALCLPAGLPDLPNGGFLPRGFFVRDFLVGLSEFA